MEEDDDIFDLAEDEEDIDKLLGPKLTGVKNKLDDSLQKEVVASFKRARTAGGPINSPCAKTTTQSQHRDLTVRCKRGLKPPQAGGPFSLPSALTMHSTLGPLARSSSRFPPIHLGGAASSHAGVFPHAGTYQGRLGDAYNALTTCPGCLPPTGLRSIANLTTP